ncbi:MAG: hypothetical protein AB7Q17_11190 [Phycisphaerae bacterium]
MPPIDSFFVLANRIEAAVWFAMSLVLAVAAIRRRGARRAAWSAAVVLAAFGVSDLVEARTGAWWRPGWLLLWKGVCVLILLGLAVHTFRQARCAGMKTTTAAPTGAPPNR